MCIRDRATGEYEEAEESLIRSTHRLPGRIYPYYLLVKLYAESEYRQPEKMCIRDRPYTYFELWVFLVLLTLYLCEVI